jgi:hypothetical protein
MYGIARVGIWEAFKRNHSVKNVFAVFVGLALFQVAVAQAATPAATQPAPAGNPLPEPIIFKLWPDGVPSAMVPKSEATLKSQHSSPPSPTRVTDVTDPTLAVYRPENPNGASMIVAPGGGYTFLSYENEGTKVCQWLNSVGVTAALLKYRTPTRDEAIPSEMPVQDAQRSIGIVRHHAKEWGLDVNRVGLLGFSAGANLAGHVAWDRGPRTYPQKADLDDARGPDFIVFIYGGGFVETKGTVGLRPGFTMPSDAPPAFFLVAGDDHNNPIEAAVLYVEYKKLNIPAELHICTKGGHGFGMRKAGNPVNNWPELCAEWMDSMGYLKAK